jgi:hypothetical protein
MTAEKYERVELDIGHLKQIVERAVLIESDRKELRAAIDTRAYLTRELENRRASIGRLRKMLFGVSTEKTRKVLTGTKDAKADTQSEENPESPDPGAPDGAAAPSTGAGAAPKPKRKGHGRNGAASYRGAERIAVAHDILKNKDPCPDCDKGKLYEMHAPAVLVRVTGRAPLGAKVYGCQRLRCNLCGEVFVAKAPAEAGEQKYDETVGAMIGVLKYGSGLPFHRIERLQAGLGIPMPAGTQWQIVEQAAQSLTLAHQELIRQAAQGEVLHNDDTTAKVLAVTAARAGSSASDDDIDPERTGVFTTGIVATNQGLRMALFFTGTSHAGENLAELLERRASELGPPIQMCDALSRNYAGELDTLLANCVAHSRRKFVDVLTSFPDECKYVIETLRDVYHNESIAVDSKMSPDKRLAWHQTESGPLMKSLHTWLKAQLDDKKVEPNSGLGDAIEYTLKHWQELTLFLRVAGAPLDNNICERVLKKAILHRKNALFFKTQNGARVSDIFMSLIHTAELCHADPFDYLVALLRHVEQVRIAPSRWMPWNYRDTLGELTSPSSPSTMAA